MAQVRMQRRVVGRLLPAGLLLAALLLSGCRTGAAKTEPAPKEAAKAKAAEAAEGESVRRETEPAQAGKMKIGWEEKKKEARQEKSASERPRSRNKPEGRMPEAEESAAAHAPEESRSTPGRWNAGLLLAADYDYVFPESASSFLSDAALDTMELWQLRRGLNEIYARHGRQFQNEGQSYYFRSRRWYIESVPANRFEEGVLNSFERENIRKLQARMERCAGDGKIAETEAKAIAFLREAGVNGFLWSRFQAVEDYPFSIAEIVYQLEDETVSWEELYRALKEDREEELETDVSYLSGRELDRFLRRVTGFGIGEKEWNWDVGYLSGMDVYFVLHGDTNYRLFVAELIGAEGAQLSLLCHSAYPDDDPPYIVTLRQTEGGFQFVSIEDL